MLHLNIEGKNMDLTAVSNQEEIIWKVLILDTRSTAIVSSVLRVNDLLTCGITMHTLINAKRAPLPDVPVIYFVEPKPENIQRIMHDLEIEHYADFYINFTSSLSRELLEDFAKKVAASGKSHKIKQVFDQYLDFIVTEPDLFSLDLPKIYSQFNNPTTTEDEITGIADKISNGLFATILAMGSVPVIRCQRGGPAELVAQRLDQKLRDHVINTKSQLNSTEATSIQRLVLILLDRNIDLASMFAHSWIYQCMVSDVFRLHRNTITITGGQDDSTKKYDIDPRDFFWFKNAQLPFPDAVENVEKELAKYKQDAQELTNKTGISSLQDIDPNSSDTLHIQQAVKALPELTARKSIIDMHMKVLAALLQELESKSLDAFFEVEQNVNDPKVQKQFLEILRQETKGDNKKDKLRTYIILTLLSDIPKSFATEAETVLTELGCDLSSLNYIKRVKEVIKLSAMSNLQSASSGSLSGSGNGENKSALFNGLSNKLYGLTDGRLSEGVGSLITGLKKLLPEKKKLPIANVVESIMEPNSANQASASLTDEYLYFDPRLTRGVHSKPPKRQSYNESIVFVVGGGNYLEYQNLQEWANGTGVTPSSKLVVYGSTSVLTAEDFLDECGELGAQP
ncbi:unnamed protein product [Kuraishia capsulata CBS 1993]|uniref:Uncharacterized protein n=1 Tax=Kuraishia capsulata CBS 1993 TaxID=1382522 RepID=W6MMF2_9ASCO|nr:uncharacterized protein KUCA_T00003743001 [Kuraishia capsulata CBS 1993]CDK27764.1 unnamed protein product [Kuraishia capsulata CBS 1993]